jgi:hypothetical protein
MIIICPSIIARKEIISKDGFLVPSGTDNRIDLEDLHPTQVLNWIGFSFQGYNLSGLMVCAANSENYIQADGTWGPAEAFVEVATLQEAFGRWRGNLKVALRLPMGSQFLECRVAYQETGDYVEYLLTSALVAHLSTEVNVCEWFTGQLDGKIRTQLPKEMITRAVAIEPSTGAQWPCRVEGDEISAPLVPGVQYQLVATVSPPISFVSGPWEIPTLPCVGLRIAEWRNPRRAKLSAFVETSGTLGEVGETVQLEDLACRVQILSRSLGQSNQIASALFEKVDQGEIELPAFAISQGVYPAGGIRNGTQPEDGIDIFSREFTIMLPGIVTSSRRYQIPLVNSVNISHSDGSTTDI